LNINDVEDPKDIPDDIWEAIFIKQNELAEKYSDIEGMGDLLQTKKNNINTAKGQKWLKDFAWRVTEEIAEAWEAYDMIEEPDDQYQLHFKEELADALHFLVELTIIAGYDESIVPPIEGTVLADEDTEPWSTIYNMGLMCNTLKNKPWKQTQMLTDRNEFEKYLKKTWEQFSKLIYYHIGEEDEIYNFYFKKNAVNKFRQRSKY